MIKHLLCFRYLHPLLLSRHLLFDFFTRALLHSKLRGVELERRVAVDVGARSNDGLNVLLAQALAVVVAGKGVGTGACSAVE